MITRRIIICCIFAGLAVTLHAQGNPMRDSLLSRLETLDHDSLRLKTLYSLTQATVDNIKENNHYNGLLLDEAELQQNNHYLCEAYITQIINAYNCFDVEKVNATFVLLEPLARKTKRFDLLFKGWRAKLDCMILSQDFEHIEKEANKMLVEAETLNCQSGIVEAYQCLSNIYRNTYRHKEAVEILEKALPMAATNGTIMNIYQMLIALDVDIADFGNWHLHLKRYESFLQKVTHSQFNIDAPLLYVYINYINYNIAQKNWDNAEKYRLLAESYYPRINSPLYRFLYNDCCSRYYEHKEQYEMALEKRQEAIGNMHAITSGIDYQQQLLLKANLLNKKMKRWNEAHSVYRQVYEFNDSLQIATIKKQYEQLKKSFNTDQFLLEQARLRHKMQLFTMAFLAVGLLIILVFVVYLLHSRRLLKKAEGEMREMTQKMEQAGEAKDRFLSNISTSIRTPLNTVVNGSLQLASGQIANASERQQLSETIRTVSGNLLAMINDILDLSRLEAGMMKFDMNEAEITTLILNAATVAQSENPDLNISVRLPNSMLFMIYADSNRLMQVFQSFFNRIIPQENRIAITACVEGNEFRACITGTMLSQINPSQESIIRNEINRMLLEHFGGTYEIRTDNPTPSICFSLAVNKGSRVDTPTVPTGKA